MMHNPMQRLTPEMVKDCVFWIIFSIAQSEFFQDDFQRSRKWVALGAPLSTDHLIPTTQRVTVISILQESNRWGELRQAIDVALSVIPWSIETKHHIKRKFNHPVEEQLQRTITEYVEDLEQHQPLFYYDLSESSDEEFEEFPFGWDRTQPATSSSSSSSSSYVGQTTSTIVSRDGSRIAHVSLPPSTRSPTQPARSSNARAFAQLAAHIAQNPHLSDPAFRPRVLEEDEH